MTEWPEDDSGPPTSPDEIKIYRAITFLEEILADGPLPSTWVMEEGKRRGHAKRTLERARHKRNVQALRSSAFGGGGLWYMALKSDPAVALFKSRKRENRLEALKRIKEATGRFQASRLEAVRAG